MKINKILATIVLSSGFFVNSVSAVDFSFTGTFSDDDEVQFFDFSLNSMSDIVLRSLSYAGGTNADGVVIARGGFDPILALFDSVGDLIDQNDDGDFPDVSVDAVTGAPFDTYLEVNDLAAGDYKVAVMQYANFAPSSLGGVFQGSGTTNFEDATGDFRNNSWAFDILGVDTAVVIPNPVPETGATAAMFGLALTALIGISRRKRS